MRPDGHGVVSVTRQGHLRLPAVVRRCYGLVPGDRLLLAADPVHHGALDLGWERSDQPTP